MSGKQHAPKESVRHTEPTGPEGSTQEMGSSNAMTASLMTMPPVLPVLGAELLNWLDESLGEEIDLSGVDGSANAVAADPSSPPSCDPPPDVCDPLGGDDRDTLYRLAELLTYDRYTDRITDVEIAEAKHLLDCLSERPVLIAERRAAGRSAPREP